MFKNLTALCLLSALASPTNLVASLADSASVSALSALDAWQDAVAGNIATRAPGSKRNIMSLQAKDVDGQTVPEAHITRDFSQGALQHTGVTTHVAIKGDEGFFSINGGEVLTRDGEFTWDPNNTLVDKLGRPVDGQGGPIAKTPANGPVSMDTVGNFYQNGQVFNRIKIVKVEDKNTLQLAKGGFALIDGNATPANDIRVAPECLESTNNKTVTAMTDMIKISRSYEAIVQNMAQRGRQIDRAISLLSR